MTHPGLLRFTTSRAGRTTFADIWMFVLFGLFGYGMYSLVTAFSFSGLLIWAGIWFAALLFLGFLLPDWSNLEEVQKAYDALQPILDKPERKLYREEIDRTLERIFQIRDRTKKAQELLQQFPLDQLRRDVEETAADLSKVAPGSEAAQRLSTRLGDLQETLVRIEGQARLLTDFEDMKKTWVASMANLRVRFETNTSPDQADDGDEVLQELTSLNRITAAVEEGKPISLSLTENAPANDQAKPDPMGGTEK